VVERHRSPVEFRLGAHRRVLAGAVHALFEDDQVIVDG